MERSVLTNTSLSTSLHPSLPLPLQHGGDAHTNLRHHLLVERIQGDEPREPLLQQRYLHDSDKKWPTNNGPVEGLPASANVAGIVVFV